MRTPGLSNGLGPFTYLSLPWLIPCEFHETWDPPSPGTHVPGKNLHSPRSTGEGPVFQATRGPALPVPGGSSPVPHVPNRIGLLQVKPHQMPSAKRPCAHLSSMDPATTQGTNSAPGAGHAEMGLSQRLPPRGTTMWSVLQEPGGVPTPAGPIRGDFRGRRGVRDRVAGMLFVGEDVTRAETQGSLVQPHEVAAQRWPPGRGPKS